jgi:hypothetical protein
VSHNGLRAPVNCLLDFHVIGLYADAVDYYLRQTGRLSLVTGRPLPLRYENSGFWSAPATGCV